jgi:hypothetical protein
MEQLKSYIATPLVRPAAGSGAEGEDVEARAARDRYGLWLIPIFRIAVDTFDMAWEARPA